jgi:hypothetical protein
VEGQPNQLTRRLRSRADLESVKTGLRYVLHAPEGERTLAIVRGDRRIDDFNARLIARGWTKVPGSSDYEKWIGG